MRGTQPEREVAAAAVGEGTKAIRETGDGCHQKCPDWDYHCISGVHAR